MPDRRAQPRGLDPAREAEAALDPRDGVGSGPPRSADVARPAAARAGAMSVLEHDLVHAHRAGQHARADVGDVEQLEQALDRAVLAERPVQDREDDVGAEQPAARRAARAPRRRSATSPSRAERDLDDLVAGLAQAVARPTRRELERDLVLGRAAAGEDGDPHGVVAVRRRRSSPACVVRRRRLRAGRRGRPASKRPTVIVTRRAARRPCRPAGSCSSTTPSPSCGRRPAGRWRDARSPRRTGAATASASVSPVTSGTSTSLRLAWRRSSVTVEPSSTLRRRPPGPARARCPGPRPRSPARVTRDLEAGVARASSGRRPRVLARRRRAPRPARARSRRRASRSRRSRPRALARASSEIDAARARPCRDGSRRSLDLEAGASQRARARDCAVRPVDGRAPSRSPGPSETVSVTVEPSSALLPPGRVLADDRAARLVVATSGSTSTSKPVARQRRSRAAAWSAPTTSGTATFVPPPARAASAPTTTAATTSSDRAPTRHQRAAACGLAGSRGDRRGYGPPSARPPGARRGRRARTRSPPSRVPSVARGRARARR